MRNSKGIEGNEDFVLRNTIARRDTIWVFNNLDFDKFLGKVITKDHIEIHIKLV